MTLEVVSPTSALLDGRYLLEDRVGKGGMATVYRAEDTHLGRTVAIKMIHADDHRAMASADRAHTEKALLASLNHPSLVALFDAQLEPGRPQYLVMEYVDGPTMADRMAQGPIPARDLARIAHDLADGLAAVHAAGIVHRDIKPSNLLLARPRGDARVPRTAKLADFGIACSLDGDRMTSPGIVLGTLAYIAPEQLRDADPGTAADIFSLGLVLVEALSGEPGYPSLGTGKSAAISRLMAPPTIPAPVPADWRDLLERMTRLEPAERPTAPEVARVAKQLQRSAGGLTVLDSVPPPRRSTEAVSSPTAATAVLPPVRTPRSKRVALFGGAAALALIAAAFVTDLASSADAGIDAGRTVAETLVRAEAPATSVEPAATVTDGPQPDPLIPVQTSNGNSDKAQTSNRPDGGTGKPEDTGKPPK
ncbi:serine/threonine-protein kinase [Microbacterium sp. SA39]|uniref:serine/threonine-protein kinase n=1 Tax=Microbacterium sp. SA39 TaxID=1263625 RepID=UPI00061F9710|nr:serine/threonine-protein kinase [Microbacterium sp. SA39]KJQ55620.1 Serine/threonine-protein kinase PknL [Microbacterium sp. SA39]